jgi:sugar phosphate isomerase/epimerase
MVKCGRWPIGVCSWSLRCDIGGVADAMRQMGIDHVHLAVRPALEQGGDSYIAAARKENWTISSTMIDFPQEDYSTLASIRTTGGIAPDKYWPQNRDLFAGAVGVTAELGVRFLSMHAGFIDHTQPEYAAKFYDRMQCLADAAASKNIMVLMETGQENAAGLQQFLVKLRHPAVGVNFDPANMILYDKDDPVEAAAVLGPWIKHIHIKDALRTKKAGTWGAEVSWGDGEVGAERFLRALKQASFSGTLAIEREAGDERLRDIRQAVERLSRFQG